MREIALHHLWFTQRHLQVPLKTTHGSRLQILWVGSPNTGSGPDVHFSRIRISDHIWCGHVEIHIKASDWYRHGHHHDPAYNTVILHVVWSADAEARRLDGTLIPTLDLSRHLSGSQLPRVDRPFGQRHREALPCHSLLGQVPPDLISSWKHEMFARRLEEKCDEVITWFAETTGDWDAVLFRALLKGFGLNRNGDAFLSLARALPFQVVRRLRQDLPSLEGVLYGLSGLLERVEPTDPYIQSLIRAYTYQKTKFRLSQDACHTPEFFALRPGNFPTLRLSQLAYLYQRNDALFDRLRRCHSLTELRSVLQTRASTYWETHYTFGQSCDKRNCITTPHFTDLLLLNVVFPILTAYGKSNGELITERITEWARQLRAEDNAVIRMFKKEDVPVKNALGSQALLQLHKAYCRKNKCLQCLWGNYLLYGKY